MKKLLFLLFIPFLSYGQLEYFDTTEEIVPVIKKSTTIGKCCQLGNAMSKLTNGITDYYLTQSELNNDGSYTIFFVTGFQIGFDKELTRYGDGWAKAITTFHLKDEEKFNRLNELLVLAYKGFKANILKKDVKYVDISDILEGGEDEGARLFIRLTNDKIIKFVSFVKYDKDTQYKSASFPIFSKFIGQLFGSDKVLD